MFVGIDGGASTTRLVLCDAAGAEIARHTLGPASLTIAGAEGAWQVISEGIAALKAGLAPADLRVGMGLAGVNNDAMRATFLAQAPAFANLALASDAFTSVLGAHNGAPGCVVALGTGSVGYRLEDSMTGRQVAGWGFPVDDAGAGSRLGLEVLGECVRLLDGRMPSAEKTPLHDAAVEFCGGVRALVDWMRNAVATQYATLAPLVIEAAGQGDAAGLRLARAAGVGALGIADALDPARTAPLSIVGGLAAPLAPYLPGVLTDWARPAAGDALAGALLMARGVAPAERFGRRE